MKVLMINKAYPPWTGGIESHLYGLCRSLKDKVDLEVLVSNTRFKTEVGLDGGYRVIRVASLGYVASTHLGVSFAKWMRKSDADIFHFHFPYPVAEIAYLLSMIKRRVVVTYHVDVVHHPIIWGMLRPFLMNFLERADKIIVNSANLIGSSPVLARFADKCEVVPYGIDTGRFKMTDGIKLGAGKIRKSFHGPIILFVGRLVPYKGLDVLIKAMDNINANLLIIGEGPSKKKLMQLGRENGRMNKIHFLGTLPEEELIAHYHACDIFVLPSVDTAESFGIVQLEAQACGKPVVSTNLPTGVTFANLNGVTGIVVTPGSVKGLAGGINKLLLDGQLRKRLGEQSRERVSREFTLEIMAGRTLEVYNQVMAGRGLNE
ncbi:MAG: glycosyltransferase [Candidatus Omnitrophica bacterium CG02_land_8_20_14_3_00__42_8]|nr:MAG: glycosyltransferase [Candidatus Omnitrophica bacterium CG02_land_8_20_14_3_00__42_8]